MQADVSIIIPCYNQAFFLSETLQSVIDQTYINWECIIVNDGSEDKTEEIALDFCNLDSRFKYFVQKNSGVSRARNFGVKNSLAKYLFFLDGDDKISKKCIESYIKGFGTSENIILVYSDPYCIGERSGKVNFQPFSYQELLYENMIVVSALIIKQIFVEAGGFDEEFSEGFEDWEFWLRYLKPNSKVIKLQGEFFYYRIIGSSRNNSMSTIKMQDIHWKIFFKYSYFYKQYFSDPLTLLRANKSLNKNYKLSLDYKIGHGILFVFRLIKNIIYRVPNTFKKRK